MAKGKLISKCCSVTGCDKEMNLAWADASRPITISIPSEEKRKLNCYSTHTPLLVTGSKGGK